MDIPAGRFVWFDYLTSEPAKAQAFFKALFGWQAQVYTLSDGSKYTMIAADGRTIGGFGSPLAGTPIYRYSEPYSRWLPYLQVGSAHEAASKAKALGGTMLREPKAVGYGGRLAIATDSNGQALGIWQPNEVTGDPGWAGPANTFCWCELYTPVLASAVSFAKQVGGFTEQKAPMGDGTYHTLERDAAPRAGARKPMPGTQPGWFPWVRVPDIAATAAKAEQLEATVVQPPAGGAMALIVDPWGATLGLAQQ